MIKSDRYRDWQRSLGLLGTEGGHGALDWYPKLQDRRTILRLHFRAEEKGHLE